MFNKFWTVEKSRIILIILGLSTISIFTAPYSSATDLKALAASYHTDDMLANSANSEQGTTKKTMLQGKAELTEQADNNLHAWQASQVYKEGVKALINKEYGLAAQFFKIAGDGFASAGANNEKYLAESRYAEGQSRRLLGQKQSAIKLYREAISLFRRYDPLSPYLKAAVDNLSSISQPLQGHLAKADIKVPALTELSGIQSVERDVTLKGAATDTGNISLKAAKASSITEAHIKKTILQAFVKMTCLETAELGSNYFTAAERYMPLKSGGKSIAVPASSGFSAPIITLKLNGQSHNVAIDLPDLSASRRTVYLVTDGKNLLAIDPATYDVWKLYSKIDKHNTTFDWRKLTHQKDFQKRINPRTAEQ